MEFSIGFFGFYCFGIAVPWYGKAASARRWSFLCMLSCGTCPLRHFATGNLLRQ